MMKPKLYTASKVHRAPMWRALRNDYPDIEFTSTWINDEITPLMEADANTCRRGWIKNVEDAQRSSHLICYAEKDDPLSGSLVEIGIVLGVGGKVFIIGDCERFSTWKHHPRVTFWDNPRPPLMAVFRCAAVLDCIMRGD